MSIDRNTWPEFVYRYVEHYRWEPQHLGPDTPAFYRKIRSQEVPLNFLFNLLLYALPPSATRSLLFLTGAVARSGPLLEVQNAQDAGFTQADVQLDSTEERVFVELKVLARTGIEQAQKYALLHAKLSCRDPQQKEPSLLYITKKPFARHWTPPLEAPETGEDLAAVLTNAPLSEKLSRNRQVKSLESKYRDVVSRLRVGFLTWQQVGEHLDRNVIGSPGTSEAFIRDFLADLSHRGLWGRSLPSGSS